MEDIAVQEKELLQEEVPVEEAEQVTQGDLMEVLLKILDAVTGKEDAGDEQMQEDDEEEKLSVGPVEQMSKREAELEGRLLALEQNEKRRVKNEKNLQLVDEAKAQLSAYDLDNETLHRLELMAKSGKDVLDAFVQSYKERVPVDPPQSFSAYEGGGAFDSKEVMAFSQQGPEALDKARRGAQAYEILKERAGMKGTLESFLETYVNGGAN